MIFLALALALAALAGCGDSPNRAVAPPNGAFSNSNLKGTYIVSFSGYDFSSGTPYFFAVVGTLTASGGGTFTGGVIDVVDPSLGIALNTGYVFSGLPTSGSYQITADGRGSGTIGVRINGQQVQFGLDFVLTSSSHGLITRFDNNGTGSGTIDLQNSSVAQSALQGSYAFELGGIDSAGSQLSTAGSFTLDANGNVTAGLQDFNDNGNSSNLQALPVTGTVTVGTPGQARLTTSAAGFGTQTFDVWVIDSTHLKLIETDNTAYLEGDALVSTGQTSFPSGPLVFVLAGEDSTEEPFAAGGLLTSDGSSLITGGLEDVNDRGFVAQAPSISGSFTSANGRTVLTLNGIYNGYFVNVTPETGNYTFAAYPYNGGAMLLEIDNGANATTPGISGGNIYVQSATTLAASQGYGLNLTGSFGTGEADLIAEFTTGNNEMNGLYDVNNFGALISDASLGTGTYSVGSNGRGTAEFPNLQTNSNSVIGSLGFTFYVVNSSTAVLLETDASQLATGTFQLQNASGGSVAAQARSVLIRPRLSVRMATQPHK